MKHSTAPIVVYCDGSASSLEAALWAIDEALWRRTWLRLVAVVTPGEADLEDESTAMRLILRSAAAIVRAASERVLVEVDLLVEDPVMALSAESQEAVLLCLGYSGDGHSDRLWNRLARSSTAPVALVGRRRTYPGSCNDRWVVAVIRDAANARSLWNVTVQEARLRHAAVMVLMPSDGSPEERMAELDQHGVGDDLEIWVMPGSVDVAGVLSQAPELEHTVVVGTEDFALVDRLVDPPTGLASLAGNSLIVVPNPDRSQPAGTGRPARPARHDLGTSRRDLALSGTSQPG